MSASGEPAGEPGAASAAEPAGEPAGARGGGDELRRERQHLRHARQQLARMRAQTLSLEAHSGDRISGEFLAATLHRRAQSLVDDPASALFFGRIDMRRMPGGPERFYVGRRHIADESGDPVVLDWRAEVSTAFYRASRSEPMGVLLRRRFGVDRGQLTAYENEHLLDRDEVERRSDILAAEIERPRVGPMRDIVATIQPEQDLIVRADASTTICVQGAPGTGKTAVGLHRAAWLLYAYRDRLARSGVLVVGPNRAFLDHVGAVLPALGELQVRHTTVAELVAAVPVRAVDDTGTAVLKGDPRMAEVLRRAVWSSVRAPADPLVVPRGARRWRLPAYQVREIVAELAGRGVRYGAARGMLPQRLAHAVLLQMEAAGESTDDRVQDAVARSAPVRSYVASVWPALDPTTVLFRLLGDHEFLAACAEQVLTPQEQQRLCWSRPPRSRGAARWSAQDAVLLDELADLLERTPSLGHVVLDEAQDLSAMQLRAVGRRCSTGAATVLGDMAQGTTAWATDSWERSLSHLGKAGSHVEVLDRGFRVPTCVIEYAARLLPHMAPGLGLPVSVREDPGRLEVRRTAAVLDDIAEVVRSAAGEPGSVGVIAADAEAPVVSAKLSANGIGHVVLGADHGDDAEHPHQVLVVPASVAKGLEFDRVVVVEPAAIAAAEPDERTGLRRLYVVLTRAVSGLTVLHARDLPPALS
ncbi:MAG TPA: AAA family ATPase [Dermatophilaceae bacterium]|nr:AAA family ATPase [Dermatophilaceae bacterium]